MKKFIIGVISIIILSAVGFTSYYAGSNIASKQAVILNDPTKQNVYSSSQEIAVVNLDEGTVLENNETIYYGEKIIRFSDDSFVYTSLEDARRGVENGSYGAYIIIPSTFSQSIDSLNSNPNQSTIKYALNTNLPGDVQKEVLYKVMDFGESLNNDISYMYLANILNEFHQAQDSTLQVMSNDLKEKNIIDEIKASDLIEMVLIPELEREENNLKPLDITEYMAENENLVNSIDEEYKKNIDDSMEQLTNLNDNGKLLSNSLTDLTSKVGEINLQTDEKGNIVYENGVASLSKSLLEYNTKLQTGKTSLLNEADELENQRKFIEDALQKSINIYNEQLTKDVKELVENHKSDLLNALPVLNCSMVDGSDGKQFELTCNNIEGIDEAPHVYVNIVSDDADFIQNRMDCLNAILEKVLASKDESEIVSVSLEIPVEENMNEESSNPEEVEEGEDGATSNQVSGEVEVKKSVATVFDECDADSEIQALLEVNGFENSLEFLEQVLEGNVLLEPSYHLEIDGNIDDLEQYIKSGMDTVKSETYQINGFLDRTYNEEGKVQLDENDDTITITDMLENYSNQLQNIKPSISSINEVDAQAVKDIVTNSCVSPLVERTEKVKKIFEQRYTDEVSAVETYQALLATYNPVKDTSIIDDYVSKMNSNTTSMQETVRDNNQEYVDFTEKVYTTTEENLETLRTHIEDATEISKTAVENGLAEAKQVKEATSKENQKLMADFASKLPYTRLGSMEFTQAYEFIASPLKLNQVTKSQKVTEDVTNSESINEKESVVKKDSVNTKIYIRSFLYLILLVMIVTLVVYMLQHRSRSEKDKQSA